MRIDVVPPDLRASADAVALEEDTFLVLSADPEPRPPTEHPLRILTAALEQEPVPPGSVVVREGTPLRLLAIVHDLSRDPSWEEAWVGEALAGVLREAERRGLRRIALQPLGAHRGRLPAERFVEALRGAIAAVEPRSVAEILVLASPPLDAAIRRSLGDPPRGADQPRRAAR